MNRLLIDAGNTQIKLAVADEGGWRLLASLPTAQAGELSRYLAEFEQEAGDVRQVWVSNVAGTEVTRLVESLCALRHWPVQFITSQAVQGGVRNGYADPVQLGCDRWAALIAARHRIKSACLVVNCGTATTIDALSGNGEFLGGLILPGVTLMQRSLTNATAALQMAQGAYAAFPQNTADALLSGAIQASCGAIQRQYSLLADVAAPVLLSGGAAHMLLPHLLKMEMTGYEVSPDACFKLNLPVQMMDNLVLQGLLLIAQGAGEA